jgi:hypothetical protein
MIGFFQDLLNLLYASFLIQFQEGYVTFVGAVRDLFNKYVSSPILTNYERISPKSVRGRNKSLKCTGFVRESFPIGTEQQKPLQPVMAQSHA